MAKIPFMLGGGGGGSSVELKPLAECSFAEIRAIAQSGKAADVWSVGDRYPVVLNGDVSTHTFDNETWYMTIIGFDHNAELETGGKPSVTFQFGEAEDGTHICFREPSSEEETSGFKMNTSNTNINGWYNTWMRNTILPQFFNVLPVDLQNIIGTVIKYTDNAAYGNGTQDEGAVTATEDKIFLLSMYETGIGQGNKYEFVFQQTYDDYYFDDASRIRYEQSDTSTAFSWWSRTPDPDTKYNFWSINTYGNSNQDGNRSNYRADTSFGLAPALCIF